MPGYDAKVYAVFADPNAEFTVSFNTKGGTPVPAQQRVKYGKYATKPAQNPFLPGGFTIYSWHYNQNGFNFNEEPITKDIEIYARYTGDVALTAYDETNAKEKQGGLVQLCFEGSGNQLHDPDWAVTETQADDVRLLAKAFPADGYRFVKWTAGSAGKTDGKRYFFIF